jgi:hypothetical protein
MRRQMPTNPGPRRAPEPGRTNAPATPVQRRTVVCFEYVGGTGLTVTGGVSGQRYRFDAPGARVVVDPRDRPSMALVPVLRQV